MKGAQLEKANLTKANLEHAWLVDANLKGANLTFARLQNANLTGANLTGADLTGADLKGAKGVKLPKPVPTPRKIKTPRSPSFKAWFGNSVLVDDKGEPLVLYHGTNSGGFTSFDLKKIDAWHPGFFLADDERLAQTYTRGKTKDPFGKRRGKGIYRVFVKMERPYIVDARGNYWSKIPWPTAGDRAKTDDIGIYAKKQGYDGVIIKNVIDIGSAGGFYEPATVYIVFDPRNIKSAAYNSGLYDPTDPDIRHNPRPARRNPLAKPTADMGFSIRRDAIPGVVEVYVYDLHDLDHPERAMVAGAMLVPKEYEGAVRWEATGMAACPGYGPLIYDLAAAVLGQRLHPTNDQSNAAKAFWAKQTHPYIDPLPPEAFAGKYGITVRDLYAQGADLTPEELQRMSDELTTVFFAAREAEAAGKPVALTRCRPNRRRR
jgi:hypothetical protein